jgi:hypothetical protein
VHTADAALLIKRDKRGSVVIDVEGEIPLAGGRLARR